MAEREGQTPRILKLQLDNPTGENKNHDVFSFVSLLCTWNIFEEAFISFCLPGHTHLDIDQAFSRFSVAFRKGHWTLEDFVQNILHGYTYNSCASKVIVQDSALNWHGACEEDVERIEGIAAPLLFRFRRDSTGAVSLCYKRHAGKPTWKGGLVIYTPPEAIEDLTVVDWNPIPMDLDSVQHRVNSFTPHIPARDREQVAASWRLLAKDQQNSAQRQCKDCASGRAKALHAAAMVYKLEKENKKLSEEFRNPGQLQEARLVKKNAREECEAHIAACVVANAQINTDFEWLKKFAISIRNKRDENNVSEDSTEEVHACMNHI